MSSRLSLLGVSGPLVVVPQTPSFVAAGVGDYTDIGAGKTTLEPAYPTGGVILAGDAFFCLTVGYLDDVTAPTGWSSFYKAAAFSNQQSTWFRRDTRASGSESGTVTFPTLGSDRTAARIIVIRNLRVSSPTAEDSGEVTGTGSLANRTVTPTGSNRLGVIGTVGFTTGTVAPGGTPSGGTWVEPVAEYIATNIFFIHLQTADLSGGGAISGGTTVVGGANQAVSMSFALIGVGA